jgi:hypothetical protein
MREVGCCERQQEQATGRPGRGNRVSLRVLDASINPGPVCLSFGVSFSRAISAETTLLYSLRWNQCLFEFHLSLRSSDHLLVPYPLRRLPAFQRPLCPWQSRHLHSPSNPSTSHSSTSTRTYISSDCGSLKHASRKKL